VATFAERERKRERGVHEKRERRERGEERNEWEREGRVGVWGAGPTRLRDQLGQVEDRSSIRASLEWAVPK
jgi:hypothetical protein